MLLATQAGSVWTRVLLARISAADNTHAIQFESTAANSATPKSLHHCLLHTVKMVFLALVWLLLLLLAIVGGSLEQYSTLTAKSFVTRAVSPDFQAYDADPQLRQAHGLQLRQGFNDALIMASVTALLFNPCEKTRSCDTSKKTMPTSCEVGFLHPVCFPLREI